MLAGGGILEEASWMNITEDTSWRRHHVGGITEEASCRGDHGGIWEASGGIWRQTSHRHLEASGRHLGGVWEASGRHLRDFGIPRGMA